MQKLMTPLPSSLESLVAAGVSLFGQGSRLLKLRFGEGSGIGSETLLPHKLHGEEGLSKNYCYSLDCLSADTYLELKSLLGQPAEISLLLPDGTYRLLTGLVTAARQAGSEGGFAAYVLTIEPALATLAHRRNSRVFQDRTVPQIVETILDEHIATNPAFTGAFHYRNDLVKTYPVRSYCLQYRESDLAFIERLLAEEGISYRYTHGPDPDTSLSAGDDPERSGEEDSDDSLPRHTLILVDDNARLPASRISREADESATRSGRTDPINRLRFHRTAGVESTDAIDDWTAARAIQAGRSQLASYDYQAVTTHVGIDPSRNRYGKSGDPLTAGLEDYDVPGAYYGADPDELARYTALRQQAKDLAGKTFSGQGTARHLVPGTWFELLDHPIHDQDNPEDRQFLVTGLSFEAQNNLIPEAQQALGGLLSTPAKAAISSTASQSTPPYRNTLTAVRRHVPVVPDYRQTVHQKPTAGGLTTATVVGPAGEEIYTDEHGRIKIQFHWQRPQDHPDGGADRDDHSSTWVRVAYPSAGVAWGSQYIPRIGQEVVIDFLEGDIDRPLVTGVVYNGTHRPPTFSGAGTLPANKTLSGHKSKEYQGSRYNELLFDDSTNEIRTKLSSEHGKTQLNQGYLIHPRTEGKGEPRGEGFELRTDESGALRAAKGLLLSTWQRLNATDKQLARDEALALMQQSLELFKQFGEYAAQHEALPIDPAPQDQLKQKFDDWEQGSNTQKDGTGSNGGAPIIGFTAPAGINTTTPESLVSYAGQNIDTVAQQHLQQTAGQRYNLNAGKGISMFAHNDGFKAIAHHGKMLIQSQHDDTQINAEQNVTVTASQGKVTCMAEKEVVWINSAGSYVKLVGNRIEIGCDGAYTVKAANRYLLGPASMAADLPTFSAGELGVKQTLVRAQDGKPLANVPYRSVLADGSVIEGRTNARGETEPIKSKAFQIVTTHFKDDERGEGA
jgi:type VI secretion system secreted protein VgrG